jgi:hypothetical protein
MNGSEFKNNIQLEKDIDIFFQHHVDQFLENQLQSILKRDLSIQEREGGQLIDKFIKKIKETDLSSSHLDIQLKPISEWKKEFTKKILLPKYLSLGVFIDIETIINSIKMAILKAATNKKVSFYKSMCQGQLFKALQQISPKQRLLQAKIIVANAVKTIEKTDDTLIKDQFLSNFQGEELKEFLSKIPYKPVHIYTPLELEEKIKTYIKERLEHGPNNLTAKLKVVNMLILDLKKPLPQILSDLYLENSSKENVLENLIKIKADFLAEACFDEIKTIKKEVPTNSFYETREKIVKKYASIYIQESDQNFKALKEYFLKSLKNYESLSISLALEEPKEKLPPQKPKKSSFWKRI